MGGAVFFWLSGFSRCLIVCEKIRNALRACVLSCLLSVKRLEEK